MPSETAAHAGHGHHWEVSAAPLILTAGILFLVPLAFAAFFVYDNLLMLAVFAGIGAPLTLFGIAKWTSEGLTEKPLVPGAAAVGLPLFIISEVFIFLSLFASYWTMRLMAPAWPPVGTPDLPAALPLIMTAILVTSSFTIHAAEDKLEHGDEAGFRSRLLLTIVLGTIFLGCTVYEYTHLIGGGFVPGTNSFSTAFFSITGFHASHVLVGLGVFLFVLFPALAGKTNKTFVQCASLYWHFVDIVWFFVVSQIYFW